jgi:hypothetical protein
MICSKCHTEAVKNSALGKDFLYCRQCKEEVTEPIPKIGYNPYVPDLTLSEQEMDDLQKQVADCWRAMTSTGGL